MEAALLGLSGRTVLESAVVTIGCTAESRIRVKTEQGGNHALSLYLW